MAMVGLILRPNNFCVEHVIRSISIYCSNFELRDPSLEMVPNAVDIEILAQTLLWCFDSVAKLLYKDMLSFDSELSEKDYVGSFHESMKIAFSRFFAIYQVNIVAYNRLLSKSFPRNLIGNRPFTVRPASILARRNGSVSIRMHESTEYAEEKNKIIATPISSLVSNIRSFFVKQPKDDQRLIIIEEYVDYFICTERSVNFALIGYLESTYRVLSGDFNQLDYTYLHQINEENFNYLLVNRTDNSYDAAGYSLDFSETFYNLIEISFRSSLEDLLVDKQVYLVLLLCLERSAISEHLRMAIQLKYIPMVIFS